MVTRPSHLFHSTQVSNISAKTHWMYRLLPYWFNVSTIPPWKQTGNNTVGKLATKIQAKEEEGVRAFAKLGTINYIRLECLARYHKWPRFVPRVWTYHTYEAYLGNELVPFGNDLPWSQPMEEESEEEPWRLDGDILMGSPDLREI